MDYVAGVDIYLAAGTDHGPRLSDTLQVFDGEGSGADLLGLLYIISATPKRSVANVVGEAFSVERGASLYLGIPSERLREIEQRDSAAAIPRNQPETVGAEPEQEPDPPPPPINIHGRVSLDFNALRTTTRWGEGPDAQGERSFNTPTFRLQARAQNLPGGFKLGTGIRLAHRMSTDSIVRPVTSTRLYQLDLEKSFDRIPLELHLGRFYNPFEEFSGFWDGMLFRLGPRAFGAGVAIGFEPKLSNEGFSSQRPKVSGFVDFDARGETMGYSGSISFLGIRPQDGFPERTMVGLSQRIRIGQAWIHNRIQADRDPAGSDWNITRIQVDGSLNLGGGLSGFAGWRRWRAVPLWEEAAVLGPQEDRGHFGLSYWGTGGGGSVDLSVSRPEEGESGTNSLRVLPSDQNAHPRSRAWRNGQLLVPGRGRISHDRSGNQALRRTLRFPRDLQALRLFDHRRGDNHPIHRCRPFPSPGRRSLSQTPGQHTVRRRSVQHATLRFPLEEFLMAGDSLFVWGIGITLGFLTIVPFLLRQRAKERHTHKAAEEARIHGLDEPASLHPVIDTERCIGTGSCLSACPEQDILGLRTGQAVTVAPPTASATASARGPVRWRPSSSSLEPSVGAWTSLGFRPISRPTFLVSTSWASWVEWV